MLSKLNFINKLYRLNIELIVSCNEINITKFILLFSELNLARPLSNG